ncbi:hypothetical protein [Amycolatopsis tolypomycina]|uniref:Uncharacterized protein n=1 Tax=Amycolatopsis tolypomycina TaxID=208445 RepID=A0A1H4T4G9_9PSEU|nr:hypothetical protein [Amycolatopsis tolypomycina]SEC51312.1 hypothetical protein SAMN04489727_4027 [Amycolatopsis tolypomycina]
MSEINSSDTAVARYLTAAPSQLGPLEFTTAEDPTSCCINLLRALHAAEEATQTARAANLADQAYRRAFGHGYHADVPAVEITSPGDMSARQLIDAIVNR